MTERRPHRCVGGVDNPAPTYWVNDARGIPLCRVCPLCEAEKLAQYRPEILSGYGAGDVDEEITGDYDPRDWESDG